MNNSSHKWQPFIYSILIVLGIGIGIILRPTSATRFIGSQNKFNELMGIIQSEYVDTVNMEDIESQAFNDLLNKLDPHSVYIPAKDLPAHILLFQADYRILLAYSQ